MPNSAAVRCWLNRNQQRCSTISTHFPISETDWTHGLLDCNSVGFALLSAEDDKSLSSRGSYYSASIPRTVPLESEIRARDILGDRNCSRLLSTRPVRDVLVPCRACVTRRLTNGMNPDATIVVPPTGGEADADIPSTNASPFKSHCIREKTD